jgi:hypothetical protein
MNVNVLSCKRYSFEWRPLQEGNATTITHSQSSSRYTFSFWVSRTHSAGDVAVLFPIFHRCESWHANTTGIIYACEKSSSHGVISSFVNFWYSTLFRKSLFWNAFENFKHVITLLGKHILKQRVYNCKEQITPLGSAHIVLSTYYFGAHCRLKTFRFHKTPFAQNE